MSELPILQVDGETKRWSLKKRRVLGKGSFGMATLYEDTDTGSMVVVKDLNLQCIKRAADIEAVHSEIQILKRTSSHPNIVQYLDSSFDGKFSMQILMEFCDAGDLGEMIDAAERKGVPIDEATVSSIIGQVLMGLHHLHHDHRILHRDLKPQNIFLTKNGVAKIGDFGVSTTLSQNVEFAKTFCGSPFYLAPEMCEEKRYNGKADLWSCGVMLYEMMALRRPFDAKNLISLVTQITRAEYPPLPDALPYGAALRDLVRSLLQAQPESRPALKRVLRSSLLVNVWNRRLFPDCLHDNNFYVTTFGVQTSPLKSSSTTVVKSIADKDARLLAEMEAWAANDRVALEQIEVGAYGMKRRELVDTRLLDGAQRREMQQGTNSTSLQLTASAEDDAWNEMYDDDFEDDEDEIVVEPAAVPIAERSFHFGR